jgi:hypothetical protein
LEAVKIVQTPKPMKTRTATARDEMRYARDGSSLMNFKIVLLTINIFCGIRRFESPVPGFPFSHQQLAFHPILQNCRRDAARLKSGLVQHGD